MTNKLMGKYNMNGQRGKASFASMQLCQVIKGNFHLFSGAFGEINQLIQPDKNVILTS